MQKSVFVVYFQAGSPIKNHAVLVMAISGDNELIEIGVIMEDPNKN